jgi:hypothetical protein
VYFSQKILMAANWYHLAHSAVIGKHTIVAVGEWCNLQNLPCERESGCSQYSF